MPELERPEAVDHDRLAEPLVGGVNGSDPADMSLAATYPNLLDMEQQYGSLVRGFLAQKNPPEICRDVPEDGWVVFDALSFNNYNNAATIVVDAEGWNGKSVRMGTKVDWNTSYTPPVRGKYRTVASLRCAGTIKEGQLGSWGVYDAHAKKSLKTMLLDAKDFATEDGSFDKKFRWIDLGAIDFVPKPVSPTTLREVVARVLAGVEPPAQHQQSTGQRPAPQPGLLCTEDLARARRALERSDFDDAEFFLRIAEALDPDSDI